VEIRTNQDIASNLFFIALAATTNVVDRICLAWLLSSHTLTALWSDQGESISQIKETGYT
jgi:hypothetical protein